MESTDESLAWKKTNLFIRSRRLSRSGGDHRGGTRGITEISGGVHRGESRRPRIYIHKKIICIHTYIHVHTYTYTYIDTYMHCIHSCIHAYICTYINVHS